MIAIVNYGVGNVQSVLYALSRLGQEAVLTSDPAELESADGVILPGVGAFAAAMDELRERSLLEVLRRRAAERKPLLGICLGLQLFFTESFEDGRHAGLNVFSGRVTRFEGRSKVPHMGWNQVSQARPSPLWEGIDDGEFFYFAHSYFVRPEGENVAIGTADYEGEFVCAAGDGRVFGVQFHPEKSGSAGERLLTNFCALCGRSADGAGAADAAGRPPSDLSAGPP